MKIFKFAKALLKGKKKDEMAAQGYCPNCWGHQEYQGKFVEAIKENKINLKNIDKKKGWIQGYAARHFEGIKLQKSGDYFECPSCKLTYPSK